MAAIDSFENAGPPGRPTTADLYEAMTKHGLLEGLPLAELLQTSTKAAIVLSPRRLADYSLRPINIALREGIPTYYGFGSADGFYAVNGGAVVGNRLADGRYYKIWLNKPVGAMLTYRGSPQAVVSFSVEHSPAEDALVLGQVQGVKSSVVPVPLSPTHMRGARGLAPLNYPELMVRTAEEIARAAQLDAVYILDAKKMISDTLLNRGLDAQRATQIYDEPAAALGYSHQFKDYWHKTL